VRQSHAKFSSIDIMVGHKLHQFLAFELRFIISQFPISEFLGYSFLPLLLFTPIKKEWPFMDNQ